MVCAPTDDGGSTLPGCVTSWNGEFLFFSEKVVGVSLVVDWTLFTELFVV